MAGQLDEQVELGPGQRRSSSPSRVTVRPARSIDDRAELETLGVVRPAARPAQRGADAGDQLGHLERLLDVVVGAGLETDDDIDACRRAR